MAYLLIIRGLGWHCSVVEPAVMAYRQKTSERQMQLSSDVIVLGFGNTLQQMVDDPEQFILIWFLQTAGETADLAADHLQYLSQVTDP